MAKLLLEYGADVNFKNNKDEVPLHLAVQSGTFQIISIIIQRQTIFKTIISENRNLNANYRKWRAVKTTTSIWSKAICQK